MAGYLTCSATRINSAPRTITKQNPLGTSRHVLESFDDALLGRGAQLDDTLDVLAMALPGKVTAPDRPGIDVQWRTTPEIARDGNTVGMSVFGVGRASEEELAQMAATGRDTIAAGTGGTVVVYFDGTPVGMAGVEIVDDVARLWGAGVLEDYRGLGLYRATLTTRMSYAAEQGATMAFTQARVATSAPILRRLGFISYGQERCYRLPLV